VGWSQAAVHSSIKELEASRVALDNNGQTTADGTAASERVTTAKDVLYLEGQLAWAT
jgi:hypothetical protein